MKSLQRACTRCAVHQGGLQRAFSTATTAQRANPNYSLYLITDSGALTRGRPLEELVEQAIRGGVTMVQVREKKASTRDFIEQASRIKSVTHRHGVPLIINDRLDVALAVGADGIHVGQDDMAATTARALLKHSSSPARKMLLGVTATNEAQARAAELAGADYLGTSAVFPTDTKKDGGAGYVIGLDAVQRICRATSLPVVAVGGVNATNAHQIVAHGAAGVGVVSAIVGADCPRTAAAGLAAVVDSALPKYSQELAAKAAASHLTMS